MKKPLFRIGIILLGLLIIVAGLRIFSGEDGWICQNGTWIQHGHPDAPMPMGECR